MAAKLKLVTVLVAFLYELGWRERGDVLEMDATLADKYAKKDPPLVAFGEHTIEVDAEGEEIKKPETPEFTPEGFPASDVLMSAGLYSAADVAALMAKGGDSWFTTVKGLGKKSAALVADAIAKLGVAAPAAAPAGTKKNAGKVADPPVVVETPAEPAAA